MMKHLRNTLVLLLSCLMLLGSVVLVQADPESDLFNTSSVETITSETTPSETPSSPPVSSIPAKRFTVSDGTTDLTGYFVLSGTKITGTVPFEISQLFVTVGGSTQHILSLNVGSNTHSITQNDITYTVSVMRESPTFQIQVKSGSQDLSSRFEQTPDRMISGTVPNNVSSVSVTVINPETGKSASTTVSSLTAGTTNSSASVSLQLLGTNYTFSISVTRALPDGFTIMANGKDISHLFTKSGNRITGTVGYEVEQLTVSIREDGYSSAAIEYSPTVGTNTYTHEISAGAGKILYYLTITRQDKTASSSTETSSADSSADSSSVSSAVSSVSSDLTSSNILGSVSSESISSEDSLMSSEPDISSEAESSPTEDSNHSGQSSALLWIAALLIFLGLIGIAFVVLDTLHSYGILKKWIFHTSDAAKKPEKPLKNDKIDHFEVNEPISNPESSKTQPSDSTNSPQEKSPDSNKSDFTENDDWNDFFRKN